MEKVWRLKKTGDPGMVESLAGALGTDENIARLLVQRGITSFDQARWFFRPEYNQLHDPYLMKDMDKAVARIEKALANKERILIYGDYDVDGTTSVAMMYSFLSEIHSDIDFYIPDRYAEGYGVSFKAIEEASGRDVNLIIALDCGIKALDKVRRARELGIDFIICDHHEPAAELPAAVAILDPKRPDCNYPCKDLSGCGVGFKLIQAISSARGVPEDAITPFLDLVAVSIASDIVPVIGENRILTFFGLKQLNESPRLGLKTIIDLAGIREKEIKVDDVVFKIGPRINAAGRMESGREAVELLVTKDPKRAKDCAHRINSYNEQRRNIDQTTTDHALQMINNDPTLRTSPATVLYDSRWHKGVVGIVASRLIDTYYRPTVVLTESNGFATGSARSVDGFDLYAAVSACSDLLENFGGHTFAAGLTLKIENIPAFRKRFEAFVAEHISIEQKAPHIEIDLQLKLTDITPKFVRILKQFEPFGPGNMSPVFLTENLSDNGNGRLVGNTRDHLKLSVIQESDPFHPIEAIAFGMARHFDRISQGIPFDMVYSINENHFRGKTTLQLSIKDLKV